MTFKEWLEKNPRECLSMAYAEFQEEQAKGKAQKPSKAHRGKK